MLTFAWILLDLVGGADAGAARPPVFEFVLFVGLLAVLEALLGLMCLVGLGAADCR